MSEIIRNDNGITVGALRDVLIEATVCNSRGNVQDNVRICVAMDNDVRLRVRSIVQTSSTGDKRGIVLMVS